MQISNEEKLEAAQEFLEDENYEKVLTLCTEIISEEPNNAEAYYLRAEAYYNLQNYPKAITNYNKVLRLDAANYEMVYGYRGDAYFHSDKYKQALADYTKAIRLGYGSMKKPSQILTAQLKLIPIIRNITTTARLLILFWGKMIKRWKI